MSYASEEREMNTFSGKLCIDKLTKWQSFKLNIIASESVYLLVSLHRLLNYIRWEVFLSTFFYEKKNFSSSANLLFFYFKFLSNARWILSCTSSVRRSISFFPSHYRRPKAVMSIYKFLSCCVFVLYTSTYRKKLKYFIDFLINIILFNSLNVMH